MSVRSSLRLFNEENYFLKIDQNETEGLCQYIKNKKKFYSQAAWNQEIDNLANSCTVYLGNLSFFTTEAQIYKLFKNAGSIKRIIMGLNKKTKSPCGFAFVIFHHHQQAINAIRSFDGFMCDERIISCELDPKGFIEGRQFGRGQNGGQVRDELREEHDPYRSDLASKDSDRLGDKNKGFTEGWNKSINDHNQNRAVQELNSMYNANENGSLNYQYDNKGKAIIHLKKRKINENSLVNESNTDNNTDNNTEQTQTATAQP